MRNWCFENDAYELSYIFTNAHKHTYRERERESERKTDGWMDIVSIIQTSSIVVEILTESGETTAQQPGSTFMNVKLVPYSIPSVYSEPDSGPRQSADR